MSILLQRLLEQAQSSPLYLRWQALSARDRAALSILGGVLLTLLIYLSLWLPVTRFLHTQRAEFDTQQSLLHYLKSHASEIQPQTSVQQSISVDQLQGTITSSAAAAGLKLDRFDMEGDGLSLNLSAPYTTLMAWLQTLQGMGIQVSEAAINRTGPGTVEARLTLQPHN